MKVSRKTLFQTNMAVRSLLARKDGSTKLGQELVSKLFAILRATEPYVEFQDLRRRAIAGACGLNVNSQTGAIAPDDQADNPEQAVIEFETAWREYQAYEEECKVEPVPASELLSAFDLSYLDLYALGAAVDLSA